MKPQFRVTYEIVTHESAENGEAEDSGFITPGEWRYAAMADGVDLTLREALNIVCPQENCGRWWNESDARIDYRSGAHETRALHPPGVLVVRVAPSLRVCGRVAARFGFLLFALLRPLRLLPWRLRLRLLGRLRLVPDVGPVYVPQRALFRRTHLRCARCFPVREDRMS